MDKMSLSILQNPVSAQTNPAGRPKFPPLKFLRHEKVTYLTYSDGRSYPANS
jgi:hypothetical protein